MRKIINAFNKFYRFLLIYIQNFRSLSAYKYNTKINSIATGKIIPVEKHTSLHVKHNMMNAKFNILLREGAIYVPFDCEVVDVSVDFSNIIFKSKEAYYYSIYIDKCARFIKQDIDTLNLHKGTRLLENQKLFDIDVKKVYTSGYLPIISFCIFQDFDYSKVFYGETTACTNTAYLYY